MKRAGKVIGLAEAEARRRGDDDTADRGDRDERGDSRFGSDPAEGREAGRRAAAVYPARRRHAIDSSVTIAWYTSRLDILVRPSRRSTKVIGTS